MKKCDLIEQCETSLKILDKYYHFKNMPHFKEFLLPPHESLGSNGCVLFQEYENDVFIGIQFGQKLFSEIIENQNISLQHASVIAEESSHFKFITDAIEQGSLITRLEIETLGEIDRFLCLLHWNAENSCHKLEKHWKNIHEICDVVFSGDRFTGENTLLYIKAENLAFQHLKNAFYYEWDATHFDFSKASVHAASYLSQFRLKLMENKQGVFL